MKRAYLLTAAILVAGTVASATASTDTAAHASAAKSAAVENHNFFKPTESTTTGSVTVEGHTIDYVAHAGTLVVHPQGYDDAPQTKAQGEKNPDAEASMFYVAYFKKGEKPGSRPITFFYNGGPGSSTVWLHMGAFGPKRIVTADHTHTPAAPYQIVNNNHSLLDATDMVFIDAPGTGYSRIAGKNKEKEFYGVDQDGHAFANFIEEFLTKYNRWNSPKYLFGESYGTPRSAVLSWDLAKKDIDLNGVMLLSQILNFDLSVDGPQNNPGIDKPYEIALPTYAATAWYHHMLPGNPQHLMPVIQAAERFAMGDYAYALAQGSSLSPKAKLDIANRLHQFTGLPVSFIMRANLRISGGVFEKHLLQNEDTTTGRLDTRFTGPSMDPLSKSAEYDPQSAAISSAYVAAFNYYAHNVLHYGDGMTYKPEINVFKWWSFKHRQPDEAFSFPGATNVMPDLAATMKYNPDMKVFLGGGYFDLATPFYEGWYEMHHLPIPAKLQSNIQYHYYKSGHMVYVHEPAAIKLHDDASAFIRSTDNIGQ
ncbi:MAG: peptidase S10 [Alphaproteobacteria bacterium]|nr:peptidase S10 [Alphaproteobacteria bacterium]